ncbi:MAG: DUF3618 domain-containing protein [Deltaproteobacteria bacterium]|nr:DUF3618 domain-containing protein [Deltaproteobacteria bacterium]
MISATDNRDDAHKDSATLEREINQTLAEMDRTLDALERKLSPRELLDRSLTSLRARGRELVTSVKQHPVPSVLLAAGGILSVTFLRRRVALNHRAYSKTATLAGSFSKAAQQGRGLLKNRGLLLRFLLILFGLAMRNAFSPGAPRDGNQNRLFKPEKGHFS